MDFSSGTKQPIILIQSVGYFIELDVLDFHWRVFNEYSSNIQILCVGREKEGSVNVVRSPNPVFLSKYLGCSLENMKDYELEIVSSVL